MLFYDLVYSPDDGGWYFDPFDDNGQSIDGDDVIYANRHLCDEAAIKFAAAKQEPCRLMKIIA